ncbi:Vi polysaccharide biosynthesis UDP-N-acetylglucosamine C-6 dehydrogenase TviB [Pontivivens insulae]|uniref:UDP-N-acetyl-D-glucosamine 6-dehydrogenase n=1 Tax=Pontivivens insulae TaxID=1639689 RepID=A0A2R8A7H8_9RHOB|nr:Vi polysaccharide biosynthesis UDP-N-acetylglucosamine C-6 dehydrogenase TviB [Pontivivens insulae]RED18258.1 UDP-N-acetyl-D-galactosamine dehydrogenase [Pontivivens insulae]SPF28156.1 UDP-N-acetyl-D-glucosamine 6-dehydrogenase [Pontivivens insulae]
MHSLDKLKIAVIGLGYVGLPLAVAFGKTRRVVGFDINKARVAALLDGNDSTLETSTQELKEAKFLSFTENSADLADCNVFIVTVPTPIQMHNEPDLLPLISASTMIGQVLSAGDIVIYESTVYPGATEEDCVPVLELHSGLKMNEDFFVGYSPERINPGDKTHRLANIQKVTSGSTPETADLVDALYNTIIEAGTHRAPSIKVAEAAKVIENTQRDLNIALINELAVICNHLDIDTQAVLEAAGTKWNFLPFKPGLVGGHCIGVDPYYLTHKARAVGYTPGVIMSGRRLNDGMATYVADQLIKALLKKRGELSGARILILGLAFKENCPDLRNTQVANVIAKLRDFDVAVDVWDPWVDPTEAKAAYGIDLIHHPLKGEYDGVLIAVAHDQFRALGADGIRALCKASGIVYDLKYVLDRSDVDLRL